MRARFIGIVFVALAAGFCLYWFNPYVEADRAWAKLGGEFGRATDHARQIAEHDGLHSRAAAVALANATRIQFVTNCASGKFKYNQTTIGEWRAIEGHCKEELLRKDAELRASFEAEYGRDQ